jgi:hypothetical protein
MKKKNHKPSKRRRAARRGARDGQTRQSGRLGKNKSEAATPPWLRIVPSTSDDEPRDDDFREFASHRNGRRQPRDLDLYLPEENSRGRYK